MSQVQMQMCMDKFKRDLPLLANLIAQAEAAAEKNGYLWTVDGRRAYIRKKMGKLLVHTVLNVLLQTTGSLCMKWGLYLAVDKLVDNALLANVHDEVQKEVNEDEVKERVYEVTGFNSEKEAWKHEEKLVYKDELGYWSAPSKLGWDASRNVLTCERKFHPDGDTLCKSFAEAGEVLGIRTPLAGEYKIGDSWHDTH